MIDALLRGTQPGFLRKTSSHKDYRAAGGWLEGQKNRKMIRFVKLAHVAPGVRHAFTLGRAIHVGQVRWCTYSPGDQIPKLRPA